MEITPCTNQCSLTIEPYSVNFEGIPLRINNITHYHQILKPRRKGEIYHSCEVYLNDLRLFDMDCRWKVGEYLDQFKIIDDLRDKNRDHLRECWRLFSLYCQDPAKLLEEDDFYFLHMMTNLWQHSCIEECLEDFIQAYNVFYRTTITKSLYKDLSSLKEIWNKLYLSEVEVELFTRRQ